MTITAQTADGTLHQFPDGTSPDVIDRAMKAYTATQAPQPQPNSFVDAARSIPGGLAQGVSALAGLPGDARDLIDRGVDYLADKVTPGFSAAAQKAPQGAVPRLPTSGQVANTIAQPFGGLYQPKTTAGKFTESIAAFAPAAVAGPEGVLPKIISTVAGGAGSEAAGELLKDTPLETPARIAGGFLGGSLGGLKVNPRGVLGDVSPETANLAQQAQNLGITVRPGQAAGRPFTKVADSTLERLPGTGYGTPAIPTNTQQAQQFTRAVSKTFGEDSPVLDQATMSAAKDRIGNVFNTVMSRNKISLDSDLVNDLNDISTRAEDNLLPGAPRDQVNGVLQKIKDKMAQGLTPGQPLIGNGTTPFRLTGDQYQAMRAKGGVIDNIANSSDPTVAHYGGQIRTALDDAFQRQAAPADSAALKQARQQYKNFKTVEPLAAKSPTGEISPALLAHLVQQNFPNLATSGAGDLGTLGKIGQRFLKDPANSNTAERSLVLSLLDKPWMAPFLAAKGASGATVGRVLNRGVINRPKIAPNSAATPLLKLSPYPGLVGALLGLSPAVTGASQYDYGDEQGVANKFLAPVP